MKMEEEGADQQPRPRLRRPVTFDDITARGLALDWPQEICDCANPSDNDQGVCMGCAGVIQASSMA